LIGLADALYADKAVHEEVPPNDKWRSIAYYKEKFLTLDGTDENTLYEPGNLFDELARISPMHLFPEYVSFSAPNRQKPLPGKEVRELHAALSDVETVKDVKVSVDLMVLHIDVWVDDTVTDADVSEIFNAVKVFVTLDNMKSLSGRYFYNINQDVHFGILDASCKAYEKVLREYRTQYSMTTYGPEPYTKLDLPQDIDGYTTWHDVQNGMPLPEYTTRIDTISAKALKDSLREIIRADEVSVTCASDWIWIEAFVPRKPSNEDTKAALDSLTDFTANENMNEIARQTGLNAEIERIQFLVTADKTDTNAAFLHPMNVFREYAIDRKRFTKEEAYQEPYAIKP
jgi:copper chaperone CopZ